MMTLRAPQRHRLAEVLLEAATARAPIAPLSGEHPGLTAADGYAIQREGVRLRRRLGDRRVGWKVGLTSQATRTELGFAEPIAGALLASTAWSDGAGPSIESFIAPGVEPEIALVMGRDLTGPGATPMDAARAADGVTAALEIVDSRFRDWKATLADIVADNACAGGFVLGGVLHSLRGIDLRLEGVVVEHGGRVTATAAGAAALDHPLNAVVWLANHLAGLGSGLKAGDVVLTGSLTRIHRVQPGDHVRAAFTRLGSVGVHF
jgi:2-keto-4-pentenoate hydratase